jgi:hypothetical protein
MLLEKLSAVMKEMSHRVAFIVSLSKAAVMKSASSCKQQLSWDVPVYACFLYDKAAIHGGKIKETPCIKAPNNSTLCNTSKVSPW